MHAPFTAVLHTAGHDAAIEHRDVEVLALRLPDGPEVIVRLDPDRGLVLEVPGDPRAPHFHEFEIRPGPPQPLLLRPCTCCPGRRSPLRPIQPVRAVPPATKGHSTA